MTGEGGVVALLGVLVIGAVLLAQPGPIERGLSRKAPSANRSMLRRGVVGPAVVGAAVVLFLLDGTMVVLGLILLASLADVARRLGRRRRGRRIDRSRDAVLAACEALVGEVRAGAPPVMALDAASAVWAPLSEVARAARFGSDVPDALRRLAQQPGAERVATIAAAWSVAHRTGAGMAATLDLAARTLRDEQAVAAEVATEIAAARATAMILALLPLGVLVLGQGIGGGSFSFLVATPAGLGCLASGLALAHLGLAWLDAIADGVQR